MVRKHNYYIYIVASISKILYIGVTNDLVRRITQHRSGIHNGFTKKYKCTRLVYYEHFTGIREAIDKKIKRLEERKKS